MKDYRQNKRNFTNIKGKRAIGTIGAEHNYFYHNNFRKLDWEIIYPFK
ncbi:hypothetical protein GOQ27_03500 [Clostridium sp. D2Q-11]|uniref:Uncharacterized protein n=1 Tax=Anaeromonas frigoriresistens TaxID=2683708 RepID=A0A942UW53_9FIRM|nr:hypothetical protein [Anaeromonas frigoriresistens]MBS4537511.1 hypothetical protein [Anaeromonas frigoriresistens]